MVSTERGPVPGDAVWDHPRLHCGFYYFLVESLDARIAALEFQFELFLFLGHLFGLVAEFTSLFFLIVNFLFVAMGENICFFFQIVGYFSSAFLPISASEFYFFLGKRRDTCCYRSCCILKDLRIS